MKKLTQHLNEKLVINRDFKEYVYTPKTWYELRKIIEDRYEEQGPGTERNPINFNNVDVSGMTAFFTSKIGIFENTNFEYVDISDWDVSNIRNMSCMFLNCINIKSIGDISDWDVSNVKYMGNMFRSCHMLKSVGDLSKWKRKVSNLKGKRFMFTDSGITNIPSWYEE